MSLVEFRRQHYAHSRVVLSWFTNPRKETC
jgi:hypothetical protein